MHQLTARDGSNQGIDDQECAAQPRGGSRAREAPQGQVAQPDGHRPPRAGTRHGGRALQWTGSPGGRLERGGVPRLRAGDRAIRGGRRGALALSALCLDTSAYSNFRRGNEEVAALLDRAELVGVPTVALGELRTGFLLGGRRQRNETELTAFLDSSVVEVLPVDAETSRHYAEIVTELRKAGTPVPTNDIWIAAIAARNGTTVLTCDDHFERIGRVGSIVIDS